MCVLCGEGDGRGVGRGVGGRPLAAAPQALDSLVNETLGYDHLPAPVQVLQRQVREVQLTIHGRVRLA